MAYLNPFVDWKLLLVAVIILQLKATNSFTYGNQNQEIIWDIRRCSNINPIFDRDTAILTSDTGYRRHDCSAIRRDIKVPDNFEYSICVQIHNAMGRRCLQSSSCKKTGGNVGLIFNVWDHENYDFVYRT